MYNVYNMKYNYCDLVIVVWADLSSLITNGVYFTTTTQARGKKQDEQSNALWEVL